MLKIEKTCETLTVPSPFEKIEAAYLDRARHLSHRDVRMAIVAELIATHTELGSEQIQLMADYFNEHGTLIGLSFRYRED